MAASLLVVLLTSAVIEAAPFLEAMSCTLPSAFKRQRNSSSSPTADARVVTVLETVPAADPATSPPGLYSRYFPRRQPADRRLLADPRRHQGHTHAGRRQRRGPEAG